jgi:hypothetical protein
MTGVFGDNAAILYRRERTGSGLERSGQPTHEHEAQSRGLVHFLLRLLAARFTGWQSSELADYASSLRARFSGWQRSELVEYTSLQLERVSGLELGRLFVYTAWSLLFMLPFWMILGVLNYLVK